MYPGLDPNGVVPFLLVTALLLGGSLRIWLLRRERAPLVRPLLLDSTLVAAGYVGGKAFFLLTNDGVVAPTWGGVRHPGILLGAASAAYVSSWVLPRSLSLARWADLGAPGAALGLATLRLGCLLAGCCHGGVSSLPWAIQFPGFSPAWWAHVERGLITADRAASLPVHPLQAYFFLVSIAVALGALSLLLRRRPAVEGRVALIAVAVHEGAKALLETLRDPQVALLQDASLCIALAACVGLWLRRAPSYSRYPSERSAGRSPAPRGVSSESAGIERSP